MHHELKAKSEAGIAVMIDFLGLIDLRVGSPNSVLYSYSASMAEEFAFLDSLAYLVMKGCLSICLIDILSFASFLIVFKMKSLASSVTST